MCATTQTHISVSALTTQILLSSQAVAAAPQYVITTIEMPAVVCCTQCVHTAHLCIGRTHLLTLNLVWLVYNLQGQQNSVQRLVYLVLRE